MKTLIMLSLRNLLRQKRKNILLGSAIAFGTLTLVISTSFVNGITDTLFNRVIVYMTGHIELHMSEKGSQYYSIIRDRSRMEAIVRKNITGVKEIQENVSVFARAIGNGKSDNMILVGIEPDEEFFGGFKIISGSLEPFKTHSVVNPIIISEPKAKYLRLKVNDTLRVRLRTINGQQQSTAMTVVAIVKTNNMFLDMASYGLLQDVKTMMEYAPNESGSLQVILDDPKTAPEKADYLHQFLKPDLAVVEAVLGSTPITVVGFKRDTKAIEMVNAAIRIIDSQDSNLDKHSVLVSDSFATARNIRVGDILTLTYPLRFSSENTQIELTVTGLYEPRTGQIDDAVILVHEEVLFDFYYRQLPKISGPPPELKSLSDALSTEWTLLPRTHTSDEFEKKNQELGRQRLKNSVLDVRTMYETASKVLSLDMALRLITYIAVLVLFVIILIGIVNSQRMTIRERTREIGTMRSIGMQRRQVLGLFLLESLFLSVISSGIALIVSMLLMFLFSSITIQTETPLGIFLVGGHLVFKPTLGTLALNMLFIVSLTVIASYFPARRASRLEGAEALRHSEG